MLRTLSQEGGPQLVARACADGFAPACEAGRSPRRTAIQTSETTTLKRKLPVFYDCSKCPAYCCSYTRIEVKPRDIAAAGEVLRDRRARRQEGFTKRGEDPGEIILRHKKDEHFGTVCRFLDSETRRCTIYEARPTACREFPGAVRCGYYDFLSFERGTQDDKELRLYDLEPPVGREGVVFTTSSPTDNFGAEDGALSGRGDYHALRSLIVGAEDGACSVISTSRTSPSSPRRASSFRRAGTC